MSSREMRSIVADIVLSDSEKYSSSVLDRRPEEYAEWIQRGESWGGKCEIQLLYYPHSLQSDHSLSNCRGSTVRDRMCIVCLIICCSGNKFLCCFME